MLGPPLGAGVRGTGSPGQADRGGMSRMMHVGRPQQADLARQVPLCPLCLGLPAGDRKWGSWSSPRAGLWLYDPVDASTQFLLEAWSEPFQMPPPLGALSPADFRPG